jgi:Tol biopolymer transport system component
LARNAFPGPWAADGRRILAYRAVSEENGRLLVVARDGGKPVEVAYGNLVGWSFSPDGKQVAYALQRGAHSDVFVVPAGGGTAQRVTDDGRCNSPVWTPKGIIVSREVVGRRIPHHGWGASEIWLVDPHSRDLRSLSGPLPARVLGSGITGLMPIAWSGGSLLAGMINEFGSPPFAVDPRTKTVRRIGDFGFAGFAEGLSHDGRQVLVEAANTERDRNQRVVVMPFAGGPGRVIARFAGDASWNL